MLNKDTQISRITLFSQWLLTVAICMSTSLVVSHTIITTQVDETFYQTNASDIRENTNQNQNQPTATALSSKNDLGLLLGLFSALLASGILYYWHSLRIQRIKATLNNLTHQRQAITEPTSALTDEIEELSHSLAPLKQLLEQQDQTITRHHREIEQASLQDPLTGLANRTLFLYELERLQLKEQKNSNQEHGTLILLDLDDFKRINDSLGHQVGDTILRTQAERLTLINAERGILARLGGDEFALLLPHTFDEQHLEILCHRMIKHLNQPIDIESNRLQVHCSMGIAPIHSDCEAQDAIRRAEIAMYHAKSEASHSYCLFDQSMAAELNQQLQLEDEIRLGFEREEFTLFLQPKVNMSEQISGFEALIRWDHPDRGIVGPIEFIPIMEAMGIITDMDRLVLEASCRQLKVWSELYPDIQLAVNISSQHLCQPVFLTFLKDCIAKYQVEPSRLELEITESMLMDNIGSANKALSDIKKLGVSIAIDDFGTGYSSLSYLKNLPIDTLKIDREFIKDIPESAKDMQISTVIIFLAKQLGFKVVAEGVETSEQLVFLKTNQCDLAQGFYFDKPMPAHKATLALEYQHQQNLAPPAPNQNFPFPSSQLN